MKIRKKNIGTIVEKYISISEQIEQLEEEKKELNLAIKEYSEAYNLKVIPSTEPNRYVKLTEALTVELDNEKVLNEVGVETFVKIVKVSTTAARKVMDDKSFNKCVEKETIRVILSKTTGK